MLNTNCDIETLFSKFLDGTISEEELLQLKLWISESSGNSKEFEDLYHIYLTASSGNSTYDSDPAWEKFKINYLHQEKTNRLTLTVFIKVAAVVLITLVTSFLAYKIIQVKSENQILSEFNVPRGSRSHVYLPDGTSVWLNAQTTLKYSQNFGQKQREVLLEGEAFFEVVRNENLPFIVKTTDAEVKVLGTAFNVKAYPEEKYIETTVVKGRVQVFSPQISVNDNKILLIANQKVKILKESAIKDVESFSVNKEDSLTNFAEQEITKLGFVEFSPKVMSLNYTSWKDSLWIIERENLKDLAIKMERRFNVKIDFKDRGLEGYVFSGKLKDESLEQVLEALSVASPLDYHINQKKIIFFNKLNKNLH